MASKPALFMDDPPPRPKPEWLCVELKYKKGAGELYVGSATGTTGYGVSYLSGEDKHVPGHVTFAIYDSPVLAEAGVDRLRANHSLRDFDIYVVPASRYGLEPGGRRHGLARRVDE